MTSAHIVIAKRPFQGVAAFVPAWSMARGNTGLSTCYLLGKDEGSIHSGEESA